jgi:uncharacterized protein YjbJ (UPF0337 family)
MDWDRIRGNWKQVAGKVRSEWSQLTGHDIDVVAGDRDQLAGKLQERYGIGREDAEQRLAAWESKVSDAWFTKV